MTYRFAKEHNVWFDQPAALVAACDFTAKDLVPEPVLIVPRSAFDAVLSGKTAMRFDDSLARKASKTF